MEPIHTAIILAGGKGTRLRAAWPHPKPLAPISMAGGDIPFLALQTGWLAAQGVRHILCMTGHGGRLIPAALQSYSDITANCQIEFLQEDTPRGTGGALRAALLHLGQQGKAGPFFLLNGDIFFDIRLAELAAHHREAARPLTLALAPVDSAARYGEALIENGLIEGFRYPGSPAPGWIGAGMYVVEDRMLDFLPAQESFSLEADCLMPRCDAIKPAAFCRHGFFIDIGVPADYARARRLLPGYFEGLFTAPQEENCPA